MAYTTSIEDFNKILALETNVQLLIKHNKDLIEQLEQAKEKLKQADKEKERILQQFDHDLYRKSRKEILKSQVIDQKDKAYTKLKKMYQQLHTDYDTVMTKYLKLSK